MAKSKNIADWWDYSWNGWSGCTERSPGCDNCYARTFTERFAGTTSEKIFGKWGKGAPRVRTSAANWDKPRAWNRQAAKAGQRLRVFAFSLGDVFDPDVPTDWHADLWRLIIETPNLDWLLTTKLPGAADLVLNRILEAYDEEFSDDLICNFPQNAKLGFTAENQEWLDKRFPAALDVAKKWNFDGIYVSAEPLLGPLDLSGLIPKCGRCGGTGVVDVLAPFGASGLEMCGSCVQGRTPLVDWVILGGESGEKARPCDAKYIHILSEDCYTYGIPYWQKQLGSNPLLDGDPLKNAPGDSKGAAPVGISMKRQYPISWGNYRGGRL